MHGCACKRGASEHVLECQQLAAPWSASVQSTMVWQLAGLPQQQQETPATCMQMAVPDLGTFHHALLDHGPLHCMGASTLAHIDAFTAVTAEKQNLSSHGPTGQSYRSWQ